MIEYSRFKRLTEIMTVGRSMRPFIYGGRIAWYKKYEDKGKEIRRGDIVIFQIENRTFAHRIIKKNKNNSYITKGDSLSLTECIDESQVLGKIEFVLWKNYKIIELNKGIIGVLNILYGLLFIFLFTITGYKDKSKSFLSKIAFAANKIIIFFAFPIMKSAIALSLIFEKKSDLYNQEENKNLFFAILRAEYSKIKPPNYYQSSMILNNNLSGLLPWSLDGISEWEPAINQKKKQMFISLKGRSQFYQVVKKCNQNSIPVTPLKGFSLMGFLYDNNQFIRKVGDIDILIPEKNIFEFISVISELGYKPKKPELLTEKYIREKKKIEFFPPSNEMLSLDVHTGIIVKKLAVRYSENFLEDSLLKSEIKYCNGLSICSLNPVHEWIYLAYHFAIHHKLCGITWLFDLYVYLKLFDESARKELLLKAKEYGMLKIIIAVDYSLKKVWPEVRLISDSETNILYRKILRNILFQQLIIKETDRDVFREKFQSENHSNLRYKIIDTFWEIIFIDSFIDQLKACLRLFFPNHGLFQSYYKTSINHFAYCIILPLHFILVSFISLYFIIDSAVVIFFRIYKQKTLNFNS